MKVALWRFVGFVNDLKKYCHKPPIILIKDFSKNTGILADGTFLMMYMILNDDCTTSLFEKTGKTIVDNCHNLTYLNLKHRRSNANLELCRVFNCVWKMFT